MRTIQFKILLLSLFIVFSCSNDDDNPQDQGTTTPEAPINSDQNIDQFIWKGMNAAYLYKANVGDLANNRFNTNQEFFQFLSKFKSPETLFNGLKSTNPEDRFSFIVDDYIALEQAFSGISKSNGIDFGLSLVSQDSDDVIGFIRYILPGTDAEAKGLKRGDLFNAVNGVKLTRNTDFNTIFGQDSYSINLINITNGTIVETGQNVSLTKAQYTENPIFIAKTIEYQGQKIGYLMYNSFVGNFDAQLNEAFGKFKTDGIGDLILDLRYNGGGSVRTAIDISSMITGQFNGEIFSKEIWNDELQNQFSSGADGEEALINRFKNTIRTGEQINSLGLTKLHVLATNRTASASELVINGLEPYIDVIQIGELTTGKFQASVTLYDSQGFGREGANSAHTYAIQPLVLKSANKNGVTDFVNGLTPDLMFKENISSMGVLGEIDEPFLKTALDFIVNGTALTATSKNGFTNDIIDWETKALLPNYQRMYKDNFTFSSINK
ncbi:C-terminal processing protease CtpA/Prc [Aquimarina sp. MAR_2010_214]|uniref:S41 family peptidase n=1 Tax=Aquimarina sp. MAR_2010_214 TaxID=1250026 RepID=UPI000C707D93|nr:S41 family peptidase [Aquimarina sp. MAR_2010_214]PKV51842.1 C-terminal processing protease CtpA/Prc [Aquimarina sp. MAR_2010_214]